MNTGTSSDALFSLTIDPVTKAHLTETAKWARFLAILGMVVLVLGLVVAVMGTTVFTTFMGMPTGVDGPTEDSLFDAARVGMLLAMLILSAIIFVPLLFLLRFANDMRRAMASNDQNRLNSAFYNIKSYFRYLGILSIIFLVLYGVIIAIGVIGLAAGS
jgi:membrane-anchored glycerophosphoryl diester phosphodiesterase (GDPDase)